MRIKCSEINVRSIVEKKLPIFKWLPNYRPSSIFSDFVAGLTVGLTLIPQAIAYAALAGLEPQVRLVFITFLIKSFNFNFLTVLRFWCSSCSMDCTLDLLELLFTYFLELSSK